MHAKNRLKAITATFCWAIFGPVWATPFDIGATAVAIPEPAGFVEVTPKMKQVWQLVQALQEGNRIVAFYIPEKEGKAALDGRDVDLSRNINIQVSRKLQAVSLAEDDFQRVRKQIEALVATRQVDAIQAKAIEQFNGSLQKATGANLTLSQAKNLTLPAHINRPSHFSYSEISTEQVAMPDGVVHSEEVTATLTAILVKGKLLMCYVTGSKGDLQWTRSVAKEWAEAIASSNSPP